MRESKGGRTGSMNTPNTITTAFVAAGKKQVEAASTTGEGEEETTATATMIGSDEAAGGPAAAAAAAAAEVAAVANDGGSGGGVTSASNSGGGGRILGRVSPLMAPDTPPRPQSGSTEPTPTKPQSQQPQKQQHRQQQQQSTSAPPSSSPSRRDARPPQRRPPQPPPPSHPSPRGRRRSRRHDGGGGGGGGDDPQAVAAELSARLEVASAALVDNLFEFVRACRAEESAASGGDGGGSSADGGGGLGSGGGRRRREQDRARGGETTTLPGNDNPSRKKKRGLTLPASAIGWLASRTDPVPGDGPDTFSPRARSGQRRRQQQRRRRQERGYNGSAYAYANGYGAAAAEYRASADRRRRWSSADSMQMSERLALLRFHLPRSVERLRITNEEWPPPPPPPPPSPSPPSNLNPPSSPGRAGGAGRRRGTRSPGTAQAGSSTSRRRGNTPAHHTPPSPTTIHRTVLAQSYRSTAATATATATPSPSSSSPSRGANSSRSAAAPYLRNLSVGLVGGNDGSSTAPLRDRDRAAALAFLVHWHTVQNRPRIDMALFANVQVLVVDGVPADWFVNLACGRDSLRLVRFERASVYDVPGFLEMTTHEEEEGDDGGGGGGGGDDDDNDNDERGTSDGGGGLGWSLVDVDNADGRRVDSSRASSLRRGEEEEGVDADAAPNGGTNFRVRFADEGASSLLVDGRSGHRRGDGTLRCLYPNLSHLKLSYCAIGELSGLAGRPMTEEESNDGGGKQGSRVSRADGRVIGTKQGTALSTRREKKQPNLLPPPLSLMPNLVSLNLSHNEIVSASTACAGLSDLPKLSALDLSHNLLSSMSDAFLMLGNIRTLILTGNKISSVEGLNRLYSLERLSLDHNQIGYLHDVAGLGVLPDLMYLDLKGNPIEANDPGCRIRVLNLFRESRFPLLPRNATYRHLLQVLPILDGQETTASELVGLKDLTFAQSIMPEWTVSPRTTCTTRPSLHNDLSRSGGKTPDTSRTEPPVLRETETSPLFAPGTTLHDEEALRPYLSLKGNAVPERRRHTIKCTPTRRVNIRNLSLYDDRSKRPRRRPKGTKSKEPKAQERLLNTISPIGVEDVIASLVPRPIIAEHASDVEKSAVDSKDEKEPPVPSQPSGAASSDRRSVIPMSGLFEDCPIAPTSYVDAPSKHASDAEQSAVESKDKQKSSLSSQPSCAASDGSRVIPTPGLFEECPIAPTSNFGSPCDVQALCEDHDESDSAGQAPEAKSSPPSVAATSDQEAAASSGPASISKCKPEHDIFNDEDDQSNSSNGTTSMMKGSSSGRYDFGVAEKESVYDGPESYTSLLVASYLVLYFKTFVFPSSIKSGEDSSFYSGLDNESVQESMPRIQLFHSDREFMMPNSSKLKPEHHSSAIFYEANTPFEEKLVDVWREDVLACGLASTSRLPPAEKPLRGFHGEVVRIRGVEAHTSESRFIIMCLSSAAMYFIPDFAPCGNDENQERRFPSPLPQGALFKDALWPHAAARHPLDYLHRITIGFQFQRLTLHFMLPKANSQMQAFEFAYIAFTCNKLRTISLLQKLQTQLKLLRSNVDTEEDVLTIDNDDKVVLDSLAEAIAPIPIGAVLHYQVLRQRWKHQRLDGTSPEVRRVCVLTDSSIFLMDESYVGDGSQSTRVQKGKYGDAFLSLVDSAPLNQVTQVRAADEDPRFITFVINSSRLLRSHRWRLVCRDGESAERLVEVVRKAVAALCS